MHFLLRRHRHPLFLIGSGIEFEDLTGVDVVHFWEEFAQRNVAGAVTWAHVTEAALRIYAKRISAIGRSGFLSEGVELYVAEKLRMIPFTTCAIRTVAFQVEVVTELRVVVVQVLQIFPVIVQWRVQSLAVLILVYDWGDDSWRHEKWSRA